MNYCAESSLLIAFGGLISGVVLTLTVAVWVATWPSRRRIGRTR